MILEDVKENKVLISRLRKSILKNKLSHGYIFESGNKEKNLEIAKAFLKAIFCENNISSGCEKCISCKKIQEETYEDMRFINTDYKESVKDSEILDAQLELSTKPWFSNRKVLIIQDAQKMTVKAQNRLLKTIEEPSAGAIIIFLVDNSENLLETIRSRCVIYSFEDGTIAEMQEAVELSKKLYNAIEKKEKSYVWFQIIDNHLKNKDVILRTMEYMQELYLEELKKSIKKSDSMRITEIHEILSGITNLLIDVKKGLNSAYAFKKFMLMFGG